MQAAFRVSYVSVFTVLAIIFTFAYFGQTESFLTDPHLPLLLFDTIDAQSAQVATVLPSSFSHAFATSDVEITHVGTVRHGDGFELGGPWDVAVYGDDRNIYAIILARIGDAIQIIDITDPTSPSAVATLQNSTIFEINDPVDIAIYEGGNSGTYAVITAHNSNTVHIIDITDPANPVVSAVIQDGDRFTLSGTSGFTIYEDNGNIYAAVPAHFGDAVQIIDITDPTNPTAVAVLENGVDFALDGPGVVGIYNSDDKSDGSSGGSNDGSNSDSSIHAIIAVFDTNMVQIIDITDPTNPTAVATLLNSDDFALEGPWGVTVYEDGSNAYAMIVARLGNAVQIIDITDPSNPVTAATIQNGANFELDGPVDVTIYEDDDNDSSYALVPALNSDTVQIIDISDPANPAAVAAIRDGENFELDGPTSAAVYEDDGNVYAVITAFHGNAVNIVQIDVPGLPTGGTGVLDDVSSRDITGQSVEGATQESATGGGCLIATAAYGTELAPQVQTLREVRDNVFLNTELGSAFMLHFNQAYYSFSPAVADAERENETFREIVKATITPAIYTLGLTTYADSDVSVLILGIAALFAVAGIYIVVPLLTIRIVVSKVRKINNTRLHGLANSRILR